MLRKKITFLTFPLIFLSSMLFAFPSFSGETGILEDFENEDSRGFDPSLYLRGFFSGQLSLSDSISVRGEFSLRTGDMYESGFTNETEDSVFRINELSATFTKSFAGATHTLSFFTGLFETVGSENFVRLKVKKIILS